MKKIFYLFILIFSLVNNNIFAQNNLMILKLTHGEVKIELYPEKAPNHVKRFKMRWNGLICVYIGTTKLGRREVSQ